MLIVSQKGSKSIAKLTIESQWGMISVLTGVCHDYVGVLLTRLFLG